jgi:MFS family permease
MTLVGVGALMILRDPSQTWLLYVYVIFFGIGFGSRAVIFSALTADIFSGKGFGSILGYSTVAVGVGGALGSWLGGAFLIGPAAIWSHSRFRRWSWPARMSAYGWLRCHRLPIAMSDSLGRIASGLLKKTHHVCRTKVEILRCRDRCARSPRSNVDDWNTGVLEWWNNGTMHLKPNTPILQTLHFAHPPWGRFNLRR